jgi:hypothetical protein
MAANKRKPGRGLRIIGGAWRSRRITVPSDTRVRPTPDRVRETLFNWLATWRLPTACCLDLYAGSGALGLEALSRAELVYSAHTDSLRIQGGSSYSFSADGRTVALSVHVGGRTGIFLMHRGNRRLLPVIYGPTRSPVQPLLIP